MICIEKNVETLVSVIIPVYNVKDYLNECLDSIRQQTYKNIEVLMIDDGSTDGCDTVCDDYMKNDARFFVIHKKNGGVASARNEGLRIANGEFIVFVDSDDSVESNYIETMVEAMEHQNVDFVRTMFKKNGVVSHFYSQYEFLSDSVIEMNSLVNLNLLVYIWGLMIRKDCVKNVFFDENIHYGEDALFVIQAFVNSKNKKIYLLKNSFYNYAVRKGSVTNSTFNEKWLTLLDAGNKIYNVLVSNSSMARFANDYKKFCYRTVLEQLFKIDGKHSNIEPIRREIIQMRKNGARPHSQLGNLYEILLVYVGRNFYLFYLQCLKLKNSCMRKKDF